jgi:hypothetical protein
MHCLPLVPVDPVRVVKGSNAVRRLPVHSIHRVAFAQRQMRRDDVTNRGKEVRQGRKD